MPQRDEHLATEVKQKTLEMWRLPLMACPLREAKVLYNMVRQAEGHVGGKFKFSKFLRDRTQPEPTPGTVVLKERKKERKISMGEAVDMKAQGKQRKHLQVLLFGGCGCGYMLTGFCPARFHSCLVPKEKHRGLH